MHPWLWHGDLVRVPTYLACLATGLAAATFVARREALREGLAPEAVLDVVPWLVGAAVVGARLAHLVWVAPDLIRQDPWTALAQGYGGFVFYGGAAAGTLVLWAWARRKGWGAWRLLDVFAPATALGLVFGRLGCLGAGCCYGRPIAWPTGLEWPWGVRYFVRGTVPERWLATSLHPTPLYEASVALALFVALSAWRARRPPEGAVALGFVAAYGLARALLLEPLRGDPERGLYLDGWVSTSQAVGLVSALSAGVWLGVRSRGWTTPGP